jgi:hypothetical protein
VQAGRRVKLHHFCRGARIHERNPGLGVDNQIAGLPVAGCVPMPIDVMLPVVVHIAVVLSSRIGHPMEKKSCCVLAEWCCLLSSHVRHRGYRTPEPKLIHGTGYRVASCRPDGLPFYGRVHQRPLDLIAVPEVLLIGGATDPSCAIQLRDTPTTTYTHVKANM